MNEPGSFSYGVDALLQRLSPQSRGETAGERGFPETVKGRRAELRFQGRGESVHQWFRRCADTFMLEPGRQKIDWDRWALEPNLAAFATVAWNGGELAYATINVLRTNGSLQDYYDSTAEDRASEILRDDLQAQYLRLDLDYGTLGPIGTHPLPHIHFSPDDPPRITMHAGQSTNVVVDFLDFIYRHHYHEKWLGWARRAWRFRGSDQRNGPAERDPFEEIVAAYQRSKIDRLRDLRADVEQLAAVLTRAKDDLYSLRLNAVDRRLACFPDLPA